MNRSFLGVTQKDELRVSFKNIVERNAQTKH